MGELGLIPVLPPPRVPWVNMSTHGSTSPAQVWIPRIVAALILVGTGFVIGNLTAPDMVSASTSPLAAVSPGPSQVGLEGQIAELKVAIESGLREMRDNAVLSPTAPKPERRTISELPEQTAHLTDRLTAIEQRLAIIERNGRMLLARRPGQTSPRVRVPPGMPTREFLQALEDLDDDESTEMHKLWTGDQLLQAYGQPDRIEERNGYTEWIYTLDDGEQLDFHLSGGLVTLAH